MTLIEVLVAFLIATIGVFGMMSVFPESLRLSRDSGRRTVLNHLAAEKIEELQSLEYDDVLLAVGTHPAQGMDAAGALYYPVSGWDDSYSLRWDVLDGPTDSNGDPEPDMKTIVVEATYLKRYDNSGNVLNSDRGVVVAYRTFLAR